MSVFGRVAPKKAEGETPAPPEQLRLSKGRRWLSAAALTVTSPPTMCLRPIVGLWLGPAANTKATHVGFCGSWTGWPHDCGSPSLPRRSSSAARHCSGDRWLLQPTAFAEPLRPGGGGPWPNSKLARRIMVIHDDLDLPRSIRLQTGGSNDCISGYPGPPGHFGFWRPSWTLMPAAWSSSGRGQA